MATGRRGRSAGPSTTPCPECGTRMLPTISGVCCPRFSACGRGGLEETGARLRAKAARNLSPAPRPPADGVGAL